MAAYFLAILLLCLLFGMLEHLRPAEPQQPFTGRARNMGYILLFLLVGGAATRGLDLVLPIPAQSPQPHGPLTMLAIFVGILFLTDLLFYGYHRLQHTSPILWPIHELHHADTALNASSSLRTYWLEQPVQALLISTPVALVLGMDASATLLTQVTTLVWLFFTHANIKLHLGVLTPLLTGPQLHRIHHSRLPEHRNTNFAQFFPVIDKLFGTYYAPAPSEFPPTGTRGLAVDAALTIVLLRPFVRWKHMLTSLRKRT